MALPSVGTSKGVPAAVQAIYTRQIGGLWQTLGGISNASISFPDYSEENDLAQEKAHAVQVTAKASMKQASSVELKLLDSLCNGTNDFLFKLADAGAVDPGSPTATEGWILLPYTRVGVTVKKLDLGGMPKVNRKIDLEFAGSLLFSEYPTAIKATIEESDFQGSASPGTFAGIGTYTLTQDGGNPTNSHMVPNGVSKIELADNAGGGYTELVGLKNFKGGIEFLSKPEEDELGRHCPFAVSIDMSYDWKVTDAATLLVLKTISPLNVNVRITMLSGTIFTFANQTGITTSYSVPGGMKQTKSIPITHKGCILISSFDAVVSGS